MVANNDIERTLLKGKARAYGLELLLKISVEINFGFLILFKIWTKTPGLNNIGPELIKNGIYHLMIKLMTYINSKFKINEKLTSTLILYQTVSLQTILMLNTSTWISVFQTTA